MLIFVSSISLQPRTFVPQSKFTEPENYLQNILNDFLINQSGQKNQTHNKRVTFNGFGIIIIFTAVYFLLLPWSVLTVAAKRPSAAAAKVNKTLEKSSSLQKMDLSSSLRESEQKSNRARDLFNW